MDFSTPLPSQVRSLCVCSLLVLVVFNSIGVAIVVFRAHLGDDLSDVVKQFFVKLQALQQSWTVVIVVRNDVGTKARRHDVMLLA